MTAKSEKKWEVLVGSLLCFQDAFPESFDEARERLVEWWLVGLGEQDVARRLDFLELFKIEREERGPITQDEVQFDALPRLLSVYRGSCQDEYNSTHFGLSWTVSEEIAVKFAFGSAGILTRQSDSTRIVLSAKVLKNRVLAHLPNEEEGELLLDAGDLIDVAVIAEEIRGASSYRRL